MNLPLHSRLRALQTASRFAPGARRVIAAGAAVSPLAALLREVNETILARTLHFEADGGMALTLEVAGRRVLRLVAATGVEGAAACLALPALEDAHREDLAGLLQAFAQADRDLRVLVSPLGRSGEGMSVGVPVVLLAEWLKIDLNGEDAPKVPVDGFLPKMIAAMGEGLVAWLMRRDGETSAVLEEAGPEEMVEHLQGFLADEFAALSTQLDQVTLKPEDPVCTVLGSTLLDGHSLLCVRAEGALLLGVIAGDAAGVVLNAWNAARA
jgi:hypothetical protein